MKNKLESLGWKFVTNWNNRNIYKLGNQRVFEHQNDIGIVQGYDLIYCDLTDEELQEFTDLARKEAEIKQNPDRYTVQEYFSTNKQIKNFIHKMK